MVELFMDILYSMNLAKNTAFGKTILYIRTVLYKKIISCVR